MVNGEREFWTLDFQTMTHTPPEKVRFDSVGQFRKLEPTGARIKAMTEAEDKAGQFVKHAIYFFLTYSARRIPEIADDLVSIDRAVRWGFAHELGPFEVWDALGVSDSVPLMEEAGFAVPDWVKAMLDGGYATFYQYEDGIPVGYYDITNGGYQPFAHKPKEIMVSVLKARNPIVEEAHDVSLIDMGDGILLFEWHTKANSLTPGFIEMGHRATEILEERFDGMVIAHDGERFSVGANLDMAALQQAASARGITPDQMITQLFKSGQDMMMGLRYAARPVVAAPFNLTLGGGCEISMAADRIVAHSELYMGLVEVGVGLIPGWGGCKELLRRVVNPVMRIPNGDPLPPLTKVFERIGLAQVATSAAEAREAGFLGSCDRIVTNRDQLLAEAKREARYLADNNYRPPMAEKIYAAGRDMLSAMQTQIYMLKDAGYASEHDAFIANKLAWILAGGDLSAPTWVDEQYILDLEREAISELIAHPKTIERIFHTLSTGKPLRN
jgi:3-hydroxyacyl-CoA dehydrogenase